MAFLKSKCLLELLYTPTSCNAQQHRTVQATNVTSQIAVTAVSIMFINLNFRTFLLSFFLIHSTELLLEATT